MLSLQKLINFKLTIEFLLHLFKHEAHLSHVTLHLIVFYLHFGEVALGLLEVFRFLFHLFAILIVLIFDALMFFLFFGKVLLNLLNFFHEFFQLSMRHRIVLIGRLRGHR